MANALFYRKNSKCKVFIVPTGTGANIFALRLCCKAYESVICTDIAHIQYQESGAAEALIGCKLLTIANNTIYPVETNQVFFTAPSEWISLTQEKVFCYPWDAEKNEVRLIASWNTSDKDLEELIPFIKNNV